LIALPIVLLTLFVGACGSGMYLHALWETGANRCSERMQRYGGSAFGFHGDTDTYVCTVHDAKLRVVAQEEIPVGDLMGRSGSWPLFPELVAYGLEEIDGDQP
jgi:hypothetical protein